MEEEEDDIAPYEQVLEEVEEEDEILSYEQALEGLYDIAPYEQIPEEEDDIAPYELDLDAEAEDDTLEPDLVPDDILERYHVHERVS